MFRNALIDWYGIQNALLNPVVKEQVKNRRIESENSSDAKKYKYKKNNKVSYIKRIPTGIDELLEGNLRKYERHTDKWGVLGHWRTYKNGKKVWIKPFEKGPKRKEKKENSNRERIIVTE